MAGNFEIEVEGTTAVVVGLKGDVDRAKDWSRKIVDKAAAEGAKVMRFLVPRGTGDMFLGYDTLESRIDTSSAKWLPGGAGGGGTWTGAFGVRRSPRFPDPEEDPASYVYKGTGLFGPRHRLIIPRSGNFMVFKYQGHWVFTKSVKGQEPQRLWVSAAQDRANAVVANALLRLDFIRRGV